MSRKPPAINTGAMADISFLLLTFFLLTSSISSDQGIERILPPKSKNDKETEQVEVTVQNHATISVRHQGEFDEVLITGTKWWGPDGIMTLSDAPGAASSLAEFNFQGPIDKLHEYAREFFENPTNDPNLPLKMEEFIGDENTYKLGIFNVSQAIVTLKCNNQVTYKTYIKVHNELTKAINDIRDDLARKKFGKSYSLLLESASADDVKKVQAINKAVPMNISESSKTN